MEKLGLLGKAAESAFEKAGMRPLEAIGLFIVLAFSAGIAFDGLFQQQDFLLPTYDNSMLHAGRARIVLETGHWAENELVFGGNTTSYHSPAYPVLVASVSLATGLNWVWAIKIIALILSVLLPLGIYLFAKEASGGNWIAGVASAFLALNSYNLMSWGTRTTPISLGVVLVVFLLYFVLKKMRVPALLCALVLALDHQPSLLAAVLTLFIYAAAVTLFEAIGALKREPLSRALPKTISGMDWTANLAGLLAFGAYMLWHIRQTGLSCLNFHCLPQASAHEFGKSIDLVQYVAKFPQAPAALGIFVAAFDGNIEKRARILLFSWLAATLILVKNDAVFALFGGSGGVFTERFITYLDQAVAVFGGIAIGWIFSMLAGGWRSRQGEEPGIAHAMQGAKPAVFKTANPSSQSGRERHGK
ncbi:MAG: hypothetical protein WC792_04375 [Candidatus Micrarchaeia archaeon]|jgi:hypothetical protein